MYRKFKADNIFNGYHFLPSGLVLLTDAEGKIADIVQEKDAGTDIEEYNGILCPGFINAHCHLELSHLKDHIPQHTGLPQFLIQVIAERNFPEEIIQQAAATAANNMYQQGIVAVGDICNTPLTIAEKKRSQLQWYNFAEVTGFQPELAEKRFSDSLSLYNQFVAEGLKAGIVPHAPYSVSPALFNCINAFQHNPVISIHNQEAAAENELFMYGNGDLLQLYSRLNMDITFFNPPGKSSLQAYLPLLQNFSSLLLVHNVATSVADIQFLQQHTNAANIYSCLCPNANLYITGLLPDVPLLKKQGCSIVLGTDSLASNHQLSVLDEIKTLHQYFPEITVEELLHWGTANGAKALGLDAVLGSFEKGKQPAILLIHNGTTGSVQGSTVKRLL
ncbi:MAG TPA: amidohydrolase family protein [Ferruginibacter sp.]|nr:amidohydrolase family protein [Ferruginibacter sp.]HMP19783.1 amidohydrolase family protein [Ferruginibacter sp.]